MPRPITIAASRVGEAPCLSCRAALVATWFAVVLQLLGATAHAQTAPVVGAPGCSVDLAAWRRAPMVGINLSGPAFGPQVLPGVYGHDFIYPDAASLDYWRAQGVRIVRLTFQWERLQPRLMASFDHEELQRLQGFLALAAARAMTVIIGPHNYARYSIAGQPTLIGSEAVPVAAFADFWRRMATELADTRGIFGFSLMNEPHDTGGTWGVTAQAALDAIRSRDRSRLVLVPGDRWSNAALWRDENDALLLDDASHCLMYDAHIYFDNNYSGEYKETYEASGAYPAIGADRLRPFTEWLQSHGQIGIVTEFGVPQNNPKWIAVLDAFLVALREAGLGGTCWGGGPWWGDYPLSIEPRDGHAAASLAVLAKSFAAGQGSKSVGAK